MFFEAERNPFSRKFPWRVATSTRNEKGQKHPTRNPAPSNQSEVFKTQEAAELQAKIWNERYGQSQESTILLSLELIDDQEQTSEGMTDEQAQTFIIESLQCPLWQNNIHAIHQGPRKLFLTLDSLNHDQSKWLDAEALIGNWNVFQSVKNAGRPE